MNVLAVPRGAWPTLERKKLASARLPEVILQVATSPGTVVEAEQVLLPLDGLEKEAVTCPKLCPNIHTAFATIICTS